MRPLNGVRYATKRRQQAATLGGARDIQPSAFIYATEYARIQCQ